LKKTIFGSRRTASWPAAAGTIKFLYHLTIKSLK
jgi:hypothetical protein